ncbi:DUF4188 domain-containing protein [Haloarcula nitratireducens]|uniref:DUF4188 domain-containing protein n=1 Tax=Haloarcula nitratireducens TaxID=2487749 RepID=A0AAW4PIW3_9EURY|nr:DUF4188 domain-containing protein [Halomicroarcula nitratireducens]MBX0297162.1 DUF4188 domain-containing protein [Halomicroarcula nitratireducens]
MSDPIPRRMTADVDDGFVVFRIGIRLNKLWKVHEWLPVFLAMPRMLRELDADPDSGLLGRRTSFGLRNVTLTQFWRSFEDLHAYAHDPDGEHLPAWKRFAAEVGEGGDVGIWHETYRVRAGDHESVYVNMPPFGLGAATGLVPATGDRETAAERIGETVDEGATADGDGTDG